MRIVQVSQHIDLLVSSQAEKNRWAPLRSALLIFIRKGRLCRGRPALGEPSFSFWDGKQVFPEVCKHRVVPTQSMWTPLDFLFARTSLSRDRP